MKGFFIKYNLHSPLFPMQFQLGKMSALAGICQEQKLCSAPGNNFSGRN